MYSSERAKTIVKKDIAFLSAGIHEDLKLVAIRFEKSIRDNYFLEFKFEKDGKTVSHTEWEPTKGTKSDEEFINTCTNQFARIDQILKCFYPNDADRQFSGNTFKELAEWLISKYEAADKNTLLRVKVVYNQNGYTTLPKYAKYTFIEPMTVTTEQSVIVKLGIDIFEKPVVADREISETNPYQIMNATLETSSKVDDLPF